MEYPSKARSRFRGALLGLAIGDALGFPHRGRSRVFLRARPGIAAGFEKHSSGLYPAGQGSDDAQTALAVAAAISEAGKVDGQTIAEHLIPLWRDHLVVDRTAASTAAVERLVRGEVDFRSSGLPVGRLEADPLPRAVAVGLWDHAQPESLPGDAAAACAITHRDPSVIAAAAGVAAVAAHNLGAEDIILGAFLDRVAAAAGNFHGETAGWVIDFPRLLSKNEFRAYEQFHAFVFKGESAARGDFESGVPGNASFVFLSALYTFLRSPFDFEKALAAALQAGGEITTLAATVGALSGAFLGEAAIPPALAGGLLERETVLERADRLCAAWERANPAEGRD